MNSPLRLITTLTVITAISGALLAVLNLHTAPLIAAYQDSALQGSIKEVLPGAEDIAEKLISGKAFYLGKDRKGALIGIAFQAEGNGWADKIKVLVGTDAKMQQILAMKVLDHKETPGLGDKMVRDPSNREDPFWFSNQFKKLDISNRVALVKNQLPSAPGEIQAITGATISSQAVVDMINKAVAEYRPWFSEGGPQ